MLSQSISTASIVALAFALPACLVADRGASLANSPPKFAGEPKNGNDVPESRYLVVDQFGYRPDMKKVAILVDPQEGWNAKDEYVPGNTLELRRFDDGAVVISGKPALWSNGDTQPSSGDRGSWFDFSQVTAPGSYFVFDRQNGVRSARFDINANVYRDVLKAAVRMFYFNRANFAKAKPFACVGEK
jgi:endoglucanase